ncbi:hypothetical protein [Apilactobacillus kunkeei]|uniref:hypothetical protein n=1 Tax=Apilactobacillus kunkeei TaxID=148814 RepID=UPI00070D0121|nr:hypothetical protein [Apilactobacillus kunkeei]
MPNDEEIKPSSYKEYLSYLVFYNGYDVEELSKDLLREFPAIKASHMNRAWMNEDYTTIREHHLFDMQELPQL